MFYLYDKFTIHCEIGITNALFLLSQNVLAHFEFDEIQIRLQTTKIKRYSTAKQLWSCHLLFLVICTKLGTNFIKNFKMQIPAAMSFGRETIFITK